MIDFLYSVDVALFRFFNQTLANPIGDLLWPLITDYDRLLPVRVVLIAVWVFLLVKGGVRGRTAAILVLPVIFCADKLSSAVIKELVARPRPCHVVEGAQVVQGIHMLVNCGSGMSFPSSHAVNNFSVATLFAYYYRRWMWWFYGWAAIVALSRLAVGVHYPSDILGGAIIGLCVGLCIVLLWTMAQRWFFPALGVERPAPRKT